MKKQSQFAEGRHECKQLIYKGLRRFASIPEPQKQSQFASHGDPMGGFCAGLLGWLLQE
ncbi:MAG: hypothetical protein ACYSWQ_05330 [Planctomycetota bacterium]